MTPVTGACCRRTGAYASAFDQAIMQGDAWQEQATVIGHRAEIEQMELVKYRLCRILRPR